MDLGILAIKAVVSPGVSWVSSMQPVIFLYLGPETVMPLASILAGIVGVLLIFWRFAFGFAKRSFIFVVRKIKGQPDPEPITPEEIDETAE